MFDGKITIYMQVYNTAEAYLRVAIESVLHQTYSNIQFLLVDNGCDAPTKKILEEYAAKDSRINLISLDVNRRGLLPEIASKYAEGQFFSVLDSDDWWEIDYLEKLLPFMLQNQLDIACTGTCIHISDSDKTMMRKVNDALIISKEDFCENIALYHSFFRTTWNKIIKTSYVKQIKESTLIYGNDTAMCFQLLRKVSKIGIDNTVLHHYRNHLDSVSFVYSPQRFDADVYLYNDVRDFLSANQPISDYNQYIINRIYINAVNDTLEVIHNSTIAVGEKIKEYRRIAEHPITQEISGNEMYSEQSFMPQIAVLVLSELEAFQDYPNDVLAVLSLVSPNCAPALSQEFFPALLQSMELKSAVLLDNPSELVRVLLELFRDKKIAKQCNLLQSMQVLVKNNVLLESVTDEEFLSNYGEIYLNLWENRNKAVLSYMTGLLQNVQALKAPETFLRLYINLSVCLNSSGTYALGMTKMAQFYLQQGCLDKCKKILADLDEIRKGKHIEEPL